MTSEIHVKICSFDDEETKQVSSGTVSCELTTSSLMDAAQSLFLLPSNAPEKTSITEPSSLSDCSKLRRLFVKPDPAFPWIPSSIGKSSVLRTNTVIISEGNRKINEAHILRSDRHQNGISLDPQRQKEALDFIMRSLELPARLLSEGAGSRLLENILSGHDENFVVDQLMVEAGIEQKEEFIRQIFRAMIDEIFKGLRSGVF